MSNGKSDDAGAAVLISTIHALDQFRHFDFYWPEFQLLIVFCRLLEAVSTVATPNIQPAEKSAMLVHTIANTADSHGRAPTPGTGSSRGMRQLRPTDLSKIEKARSRTLKLTILIVTVFIVCFTPYAVMVLWYQIDKASAKAVDQTLQVSPVNND